MRQVIERLEFDVCLSRVKSVGGLLKRFDLFICECLVDNMRDPVGPDNGGKGEEDLLLDPMEPFDKCGHSQDAPCIMQHCLHNTGNTEPNGPRRVTLQSDDLIGTAEEGNNQRMCTSTQILPIKHIPPPPVSYLSTTCRWMSVQSSWSSDLPRPG